MGWLLWLTVYCTHPGPDACPASYPVRWERYTFNTTRAQCEEARTRALAQGPEPGLPRGFLLDAVCVVSLGTVAPGDVHLVR